ncbi:MAG: peptide deformylase [Oscillospiraceae bacterium]|jgi:peptide deformylase|nr:peptide deformylase [Oscillospiraceae bacterium]
MGLRKILNEKDGEDAIALRKTSRAVTDFNKRLHKLLDDMRETLIDANGLGLAAPQVGVLRRVVLVVDLSIESEDIDDQIIELINPEIIAESGEQTGNEGCLSLPGIYGIVSRPDTVKVRAFDRYGKPFEAFGEGLTARAFCHEINHLDGIIFTDLAERLLTPEELEAMMHEGEEDDEE